jgi:anti-sigma factor RsiW
MSHLGHRLSALIDGELDHMERERVLVHLVRCEQCRAESIALRTLKRRMKALGGAAADSALTHRLIGLAMPGNPLADARAIGEPGWLWPAVATGRGSGARELRPSRFVVAGCCAFLLVSLGAAAFAAGGGSPQPGPQITPAVDVFMVQHEIMTGVVPVTRPSPAPSAGKSAAPFAP